MLLFIGLRQIVIVLGVIFILRLIGKVMSARKNINEQTKHYKQQEDINQAKQNAKRNFGKTSIHKIDKSKISDTEYSDFEEVD